MDKRLKRGKECNQIIIQYQFFKVNEKRNFEYLMANTRKLKNHVVGGEKQSKEVRK